MHLRHVVSCSLVALSVAWLCAGEARACTGIRLHAKDGAVVYARTMEFGFDLQSQPIVIPRGYKLHGTTENGKPGLAWETRFAVAGLNALGMALVVDGVNQKGLAGGIFYMPGYARYQQVQPGQESHSLAPWELMTWILTNFATVDKVRAELPSILVNSAVFDGFGFTPPVHFVIHDAAGDSLVIEYLDGKATLRDNPVGVITNAPEFDWHIKNLSNYINLTPDNAAAERLSGLTVRQFGQGTGMLGLPGDFTPPSRFVRAVIFTQNGLPVNTGEEAVSQAFHVLDSFDIPLGSIKGVEDGKPSYEYTQWTTAADLKNVTYQFHSLDNRRVRKVELLKADLDSKDLILYPFAGQNDVETLSPVAGAAK